MCGTMKALGSWGEHVPADGFANHHRDRVHRMLFMVIERFRNRDGPAVYRRARERGRMLPDGLEYLGSWVEPNLDRCFQLMQCDNPELLDSWAARWEDLVDFEFVPVVTGAEMARTMSADV